jgi:hypothetical protein
MWFEDILVTSPGVFHRYLLHAGVSVPGKVKKNEDVSESPMDGTDVADKA